MNEYTIHNFILCVDIEVGYKFCGQILCEYQFCKGIKRFEKQYNLQNERTDLRIEIAAFFLMRGGRVF